MPWLDVVRGIAVALVMLRHAWGGVFPAAGIVGVTMFFALSGFLITGIIDRDLAKYQRLRLGRFYAHRLFRLYPALILLIFVFTFVEVVWNVSESRGRILSTIAVSLTYLANFVGTETISGAMTHLWSLAVEEQFYLVWPLILLIGSRWLGRPKLALWVLILGVVLVGASAASALLIEPVNMYQLPTTWASSMALGGFAYAIKPLLATMFRASQWSLSAFVVLALLCFLPDAKEHTWTYLIYPTLVAVATLIIVVQLEGRDLPAAAVLRVPLRASASLGVISYATYLWNFPISVWWAAATAFPVWADVITIPITIASALVSWYSVEALGRFMRHTFDRGRN